MMKMLPEGFAREYHQRFLTRVLQSKEAWALVTPGGKLSVSDSNRSEDRPVQLFWSDRAYAQRCATGPWSDRVAKPVSLERLLEDFLPRMHQEHWLVGCNWDANLIGLEVEPLALVHELRAAWTDRTREVVDSLVPHPAPPQEASRPAARAPRRPSRPRRPRATPAEFNDGAVLLPTPARPWRAVPEPLEGVLHELRFGRGLSAPSLRILEARFPKDEADWCRWRFERAMDSEPGTRPGLGERLWRQFGLTVKGPETCQIGKLLGRRYVVARPQVFTLYFQWIFLDLTRGQRVFEFATEWRRRDADLRELTRVLEPLGAAR